MIGSRPYQHEAIIDILRDFLFGLHSTVSAVTRNHFDPAEAHVNMFPPSTIALVATAVCCSVPPSLEMLTMCRYVQALMNGVVVGVYLCFFHQISIQIYITIIWFF